VVQGDVFHVHLCAVATQTGAHVPKIQKTKQGEQIPAPKRGDFFDNLKKAATPTTSERRDPKQK
jgi:hypothetical protein